MACSPVPPNASLDARAVYGPSGAAIISGQPKSTYALCKEAISDLAQPHAPLEIQVIMTGPIEHMLDRQRSAKLFVRIVYDRMGGIETRKAHVECNITRSGTSLVLTER
jgi:hypothetical protein